MRTREGCCAGWPKPCGYHEGWEDAENEMSEEPPPVSLVADDAWLDTITGQGKPRSHPDPIGEDILELATELEKQRRLAAMPHGILLAPDKPTTATLKLPPLRVILTVSFTAIGSLPAVIPTVSALFNLSAARSASISASVAVLVSLASVVHQVLVSDRVLSAVGLQRKVIKE
jgi:hypothetical protein